MSALAHVFVILLLALPLKCEAPLGRDLLWLTVRWHTPFILVLGRQRQVDLQASPGYIMKLWGREGREEKGGEGGEGKRGRGE